MVYYFRVFFVTKFCYLLYRTGKGGVSLKELNELYKLHHKKIYNYLYGLTGKRELAEDLLQETFYKAFIKLDDFRGDSKVSTWLFQIAKFTYHNDKRSVIKNIKLIEGLKKTHEDSKSSEEIIIEKEDKRELLLAINELSDIQREVVILRAFNDMSFKEIALVVDKTENWSKVTFFRSKQKLYEKLRERGVNIED